MSSYHNIYEGASSYLTPKKIALDYLSTGYQSRASSLGMSTDPRTANQLGELNLRLNPGIKHMEVGAIQGAVMESIPNQHLDEMRRVAKLAGVKTSMHAPIIEASGIGEKGGWEEANRLGAQIQLESALKRSHRLDPNGNVIVTVHSTAQLPEMINKIKEDGKEKPTSVWIINPESGKIAPIEYEKRYFPQEGEKEGQFKPGEHRPFNPDEEIKKINNEQWTSSLSEVNRLSNYGEDTLERLRSSVPDSLYKDLITKEINFDEIKDEEDRKTIAAAQKNVIHGQIYLRDAYRGLKNLYDKAYSSAIKEEDIEKKKHDLEILNKFADDIKGKIKSDIDKDPRVLGEVVEQGLRVLGKIEPPKSWTKLQDFVVKKSAETYGNVAANAYKEFGDNSPILSIENPPAGQGLSRAEDLRDLINESRKVFANKLKDQGIGEREANKAAEKFIGATWDVGHINMLRKKGYDDKDLIEQAKTIAPYLKHVHLSDNFGLDHTELPMGMGNVPIKEVLKVLGKKGENAVKVIEAGNWWQYFADKGGGNPYYPSLQSFDSPLYAMGGGPYWSQVGGYGMYYSGQGPINPAVHHRVYGSGFENLPLELGGEMQGERGRFSGTPNA
ncbi:MAG: TIM barrel protein [Candidatus Pacearchaeota archaeon]|jgi:hypothetical protein